MVAKFKAIEGRSVSFYVLMGVLAILVAAGLVSSYLMYADGLYFTGMTNRIPWGLQIIMAVFYIGLSAGSLVISSMYAIFGKQEYKPFARISVLLAMLFLVAALMSIILDVGRPDHSLILYYYLSPTSMFTFNTVLYNGYIVICLIYLWAMFTEREKLVKIVAVIAVIWAIGVHSGTGAIFGFVPRELFGSPLLPPSFIAAALSSGTATVILVILATFKLAKRPLDDRLIGGLSKLLAVFVLIVLYFIFVENAYRLYIPESREAAMYVLFQSVHGVFFWLGLVFLGSIVPAAILFHRKAGKSISWIIAACVLVVVGIFADRWLIVIPGQTHPQALFPNMEITRSVVEEGFVSYMVSLPEVVQAAGIMAVVAFAFILGLRLFRMLPTEARMQE